MNDRSSNRTIAVLTVARSDFGRYRPVLRELDKATNVELRLLASGNHFDGRFGHTIDEIEASGYAWVPGLGMKQDGDRGVDIGCVVADGTQKLAKYFDHERPNLLVILGDRYEMLAGAVAALGFGIPVAHIHGGAVTEGAIDELVRHALTKMSHLHMVACAPYAARLRQMGEEAWRVHVTGAPGLDDLADLADMDRPSISREISIDLEAPTLLVCLHPETVTDGDVNEQVDALLLAVERSAFQAVFTYPNTDPGSHIIIEKIGNFVDTNADRARLIRNAGTRLFVNLMANVSCMVGNSSSAIVEAPTFKLPAVDIGARQQGKLKAANIVSAEFDAGSISAAIEKAMSATFRKSLAQMTNPYGDGKAGKRIAEILVTTPIDSSILRKKFVDA